jgi:hypothetical protein
MSEYRLTNHEKDLIDKYIIKVVDAGSANKFSLALFNNALCNTLPTWRAEILTSSNNERSIAYIDYVKDFHKNL